MTTTAPNPLHIYLWDRRFMLRCASYVLDRAQKPFRRLSATLIVATRAPFRLAVNDQPVAEYQAVLIAPNVLRQVIEALDADVTIVDAGLTSPAFRLLEPQLLRGDVRALSDAELARVRALLAGVSDDALDCERADRLFTALCEALGPAQRPPAPARDPRIERVLQRIDEWSFDETSVPALALVAELSESRLRGLFGKTMGCTLQQYIRWVNAWKAIRLWQRGMTFTDVAHAVGFHDLAHIDHALNELFGMSPSAVTDLRRVQLRRCG